MLDSLRGDKDPDAQKIFYTVASRIKKLWKKATNSKGEHFSPRSIDDFGMSYVNVPKQTTALVPSLLVSFFNFFFIIFLLPFIFVHRCLHLFCLCRHDCGFFMFQYLGSFDGESYVLFNQNDILSIRMTILYSWLTGGGFDIDLQAVLGVDAGMLLYYYIYS